MRSRAPAARPVYRSAPAAALLLTAASVCHAMDRHDPGVPDEGLTLGGGIADVDPGIIGDHRRIDPFPLVSYRSGRFFLSGTSAGVIAAESDDYALRGIVVPQFTRLKAGNSRELAGIQTRQWTLDGGLKLSSRQPWGDASITAVHDLLDRSNGTELKADYSYSIPVGAGRLIPGVGVAWQDVNMTRYYYGVSAAEALPDRPAYTPGSALNPSVKLDYSLPLPNRWRLGAGISYTHFDRSIRNSPLIDQPGSRAFTLTLQRSIALGAKPAAPEIMPIEH